MIKLSVLYPNEDGKKFDMEYYLNKHLPMSRENFGAALKDLSVEQGLGGAVPGSPAPYVVMAHLTFDSLESFQKAFSANAAVLIADMPNYTDIQPTIQVSEVKI